MMSLSKSINRQVPLVPGETEHQWDKTKLYGCGVCTYHWGYMCAQCGRCVDSENDWALYALIFEHLRGPMV